MLGAPLVELDCREWGESGRWEGGEGKMKQEATKTQEGWRQRA